MSSLETASLMKMKLFAHDLDRDWPHRHTRIVATLGPATESPQMIESLVGAGVNVFRLNMSHASHQTVRTLVPLIRDAAKRLARNVAILMDTQGPAIRTGELKNALSLKPGDVFIFTVRGEVSNEEHSVDVNYDDLLNDISVGDTVLVDNGVIHMRVLAKDENKLRCEVLTPGTLGSRRHINLPGVKVNLPALTQKDQEDIALGLELGVDFIALSFVREAADVAKLREFILKRSPNRHVPIVAKLEDQLAIKNVDEIINSADVVMVARGDLGVECPYEELPIIQRRIVKKCLEQGKPVIVATHMLESMISHPMATRAEVTDVANAVYEQADAIMLSGETSVGSYPLDCIRVMDRIARRTEMSGGAGYASALQPHLPREHAIASAVHLANSARAAAILIFTHTGRSAAFASALRPKYSPIFAFTSRPEILHSLIIHRGVNPMLIEFSEDRQETLHNALRKLKERRMLNTGDAIVVVTDFAGREHVTSAVQFRVF